MTHLISLSIANCFRIIKSSHQPDPPSPITVSHPLAPCPPLQGQGSTTSSLGSPFQCSTTLSMKKLSCLVAFSVGLPQEISGHTEPCPEPDASPSPLIMEKKLFESQRKVEVVYLKMMCWTIAPLCPWPCPYIVFWDKDKTPLASKRVSGGCSVATSTCQFFLWLK